MQALYDQLRKYGKTNAYPFHMPGHKRNMPKRFKKMFSMDITEIPGFDDLHHAEGVLLKARKRAASLYRSEQTYFLINGSTGGILSAIFATTKFGGTILMARNSHKAAYHAAFLRNNKVEYLYPKTIEEFDINGGINPVDIEKALAKNEKIEVVFITSPTTEGIVTDIEKIAKICHKYGKPLIVDEAHGAHFALSELFPKSAIQCGADIVIESVHKTLPALTQTALLHINGKIVKQESVEEYLEIFQTSSPSYILMGSIEFCVSILEKRKEKLYKTFTKNLGYFENKMKELQNVQILTREKAIDSGTNVFALDPGKLVFSIKGMKQKGPWFEELLRNKYGLQMEMVAPTYVLGIATIMDTKKGFRRLANAILAIDKILSTEDQKNSYRENILQEIETEQATDTATLSMAEAKKKPYDKIALIDAAGRVSREFIVIIPPGIPAIVPGERIEKEMLQKLLGYKKMGLQVQGLHDKSEEMIEVLVEDDKYIRNKG